MIDSIIPNPKLQIENPPKKISRLKLFLLITLIISAPSFFTYLAFININKPHGLFELIQIWLYIFIFIGSVVCLLVFPKVRLKLQANRFLQVSSFIVLTYIAITSIRIMVVSLYVYFGNDPIISLAVMLVFLLLILFYLISYTKKHNA